MLPVTAHHEKPDHMCSCAGPSAKSAGTFVVMVASPEYTCAAGKLRYAKSPAKSLIYQTVDEVPEKGKKCARSLRPCDMLLFASEYELMR